jgi:hypothetical protein
MNINTSDLQKFFEVIESKKLSIFEVIALISDQIEKKSTTANITSTGGITLTIDYTKTLEQAIADCKFDHISDDVTTENFPFTQEVARVDISARLFDFGRDISSHDAIKEMDRDGCRPATLMELLALAVANPELQRQHPIVALGSILRGSLGICQVPYLSAYGSGRGLFLGGFDDGWSARCRFFGIRK